MKIKDVMKKVVVSGDNITGRDAAKIMSSKGIGSLVILKKNKIVGIVTERDIIKDINKLNNNINSFTSKNVITIDKDETLDNAASIMASKKIKRLPVVDEGKLIGIITVTDLIANSDELNEAFFIE